MRIRGALSAVILGSLASALFAAEHEYVRPRLLVEPSRLAEPRSSQRWVILDARPKEAYDEEHVPGARWVDHDTWKSALADGTDVEGWSRRIGAMGIDADSRVVVYDDASAKDAARIWWILRYWNVRGARLLNGGWKQWKEQGLPTSAQEPSPPQAVDFRAVPRRRKLTTKDQILDSLAGHELQILDTRSESEFCGIDLKGNKRGGAIPAAKRLEWSELIDPVTNRFRGAEELRRLFDQAGVDLDTPIASHCQSGGRASVMTFGLELMGAKDARNYYPGWSEWGNDEDVPIVTPEKN